MSAKAEASGKRQKVQRITDWDDARYSFLPARTADDLRATQVHLRLLVFLGRVNNNNGWTELSQKATAERWQYARSSINEAIRDLVDWGYVEKKSQAETNTALCQYRLLIDKPEIAVAEGGKGEAAKRADGDDVSGMGDTSRNFAVSAAGDTSVGSEATPVSPHRTQLLDRRSENSPPQSPAGERGSRKKVDDVEGLLGGLANERPEPGRRFAVDGILRPIVVSRKLDAPGFVSALRALADWIATKSLTEAEGTRVVERILAVRRASVKPSDIEDEVNAVIGCRPQRPAIAGDPRLMERWPLVLDALTAQLGPDKVNGWFSTVVIVKISGSRAEIATHIRHVKRRLDEQFSPQLRRALSNVYGVDDVIVSLMRVAA